jgi:hypothetical protein
VTVPGVNTGCVHGVPWLVRNLGELLATGLSREDRVPLAEILATAISEPCGRHGDSGCHCCRVPTRVWRRISSA